MHHVLFANEMRRLFHKRKDGLHVRGVVRQHLSGGPRALKHNDACTQTTIEAHIIMRKSQRRLHAQRTHARTKNITEIINSEKIGVYCAT